jgi:site-specific recombinase
VFHERDDWIWLQAIPPALSQRFWHTLAVAEDDDTREALRHVGDQMLEALLVLAYRIGGLAVEQEFGRLGPRFTAHAPRVRGLASTAQRFVDACRAHALDPQAPRGDDAELQVMVDQCHELLERRAARLPAAGHQCRPDVPSAAHAPEPAAHRDARALVSSGAQPRSADGVRSVRWWTGPTLVRDALRAENQRNSLREHLSKGVALLALRVTDNAAKTGEHYIADIACRVLLACGARRWAPG